ncbi:hypothetical protein JTB14_015728 [Gonioctena quinquepunctata]|nr:hypothetical protein JTB14_015728 [Gonioctena quinquepunctata]
MLEAFRGCCHFTHNIANEPTEHSFKIYVTVDARKFYTDDLKLHARKQPNGPFQIANDEISVVNCLPRHYSGTGKSITMDNQLTSVPLANDLYNNQRLTLVDLAETLQDLIH